MKKNIIPLILSLIAIFCLNLGCLALGQQQIPAATANNDPATYSNDEIIVLNRRTNALYRAISESIVDCTVDSITGVLNGRFESGLCPRAQVSVNEDLAGKKPIELALNVLISKARTYNDFAFLASFKSRLFNEPWIIRKGFRTSLHWEPLLRAMEAVHIILAHEDFDLSKTHFCAPNSTFKEKIDVIRSCEMVWDEKENERRLAKFSAAVRAGEYDCLITP